MAKKILLADDSITIQKVVELTFSDGDYEVTAVNNGAKAIQKLSEMRPDIILSDIIMPEKNGYEVCEYVKSHPEYRNIPVILLTGTFEPFDPDRADKAGCDAVVTKPFESQSLIHKVEELVQQSRSNASAAEPEEAVAPALFADMPSFEEPAPAAAVDPFAHDDDIFSAAPAAASPTTTDMPFDAPPEPAYGNETRALPRMSFEEMQQMANAPSTPAPHQEEAPAPEPSPWDEPAPAFGGETRAFPRMSFEEMEQMASASQPAAETPAETPSPFEAAPSSPAEETSPWDEPKEDAGATRAFPAMSFEEMRQMAEAQATPAPFETQAEVPAPAEPSPWDEAPSSFGGETRAFPRMSFEELEKMAAKPAATPEPEPQPEPEPAWSAPEELPTADPFADTSQAESPFAAEVPEPALAEEAPWTEPAAPEAAAASTEVNSQITDSVTDAGAVPADLTPDLTDAQVDRIARRVVQLMADKVVRDIAWEVIPDLAEMVVKERIRQLEAEG
ncbi:MAG TPA: response regulator [Thermoanaerobaculia bacterium]|nr:response regulator [Thermoanaerobaculia bacterium]